MRCPTLSLLGVLALALMAQAADQGGPSDAAALRPGGAAALSAPLADDAIYLFENSGFKGDATRIENVTANPAAKPLRVERSDRMSSLRWKLPPGVVVTLFENADGQGNQMSIWGAGEVASVSRWKFNDKVSRWAWFYVGGVSNAPEKLTRALAPRPLDARPTGTVAAGTVELFENRDLRGTMHTVGPVDKVEQGALQTPKGATDRMTSLRWNLAPGVVILLYEDADGRGRQMAIWGSGEYPTVAPFNFNDKLSRWAWFNVAK